MYTYAATISLLSALAAAAPHSHQTNKGTVTLQVGLALGGDDSSTTRTVSFGKKAQGIFPPASSIVVGGGNGVPVEQNEIICQAFSDAASSMVLGPTFNNVLPGIAFGDGSSLVTIGSVYCADADGVAAFTIRNAAPIADTPTSGAPMGSVSKVNIKLDFDQASAGASVGSVPVDGELALVKDSFATRNAFKAAIQLTNGEQPSGVTCEAFGDEAGQQKIGDVSGNGEETIFGQGNVDVPIGAFKCTSA